MAVFFYIASSLKKTEDFPTFNYLFTLFKNMKTKKKLYKYYRKIDINFNKMIKKFYLF